MSISSVPQTEAENQTVPLKELCSLKECIIDVQTILTRQITTHCETEADTASRVTWPALCFQVVTQWKCIWFRWKHCISLCSPMHLQLAVPWLFKQRLLTNWVHCLPEHAICKPVFTVEMMHLKYCSNYFHCLVFGIFSSKHE